MISSFFSIPLWRLTINHFQYEEIIFNKCRNLKRKDQNYEIVFIIIVNIAAA